MTTNTLSFPTNTRLYRFFEKDNHVSHAFIAPTFMVDGMVRNDLSSGDEVSKWAAALVG